MVTLTGCTEVNEFPLKLKDIFGNLTFTFSLRHGNANGQWSGQRKVRREVGASERGNHPTKASLAHSPARIAQANWNFVETLLKVS